MGKSLKSPSPIYSTSEDDLPPPPSGCVSYSVVGALQALGAKYSNGEGSCHTHYRTYNSTPGLSQQIPKTYLVPIL